MKQNGWFLCACVELYQNWCFWSCHTINWYVLSGKYTRSKYKVTAIHVLPFYKSVLWKKPVQIVHSHRQACHQHSTNQTGERRGRIYRSNLHISHLPAPEKNAICRDACLQFGGVWWRHIKEYGMICIFRLLLLHFRHSGGSPNLQIKSRRRCDSINVNILIADNLVHDKKNCARSNLWCNNYGLVRLVRDITRKCRVPTLTSDAPAGNCRA